MKTEQIVYCVVALLLGMLLANMLKNVCGCKLTEGQASPPHGKGTPLSENARHATYMGGLCLTRTGLSPDARREAVGICHEAVGKHASRCKGWEQCSELCSQHPVCEWKPLENIQLAEVLTEHGRGLGGPREDMTAEDNKVLDWVERRLHGVRTQ